MDHKYQNEIGLTAACETLVNEGSVVSKEMLVAQGLYRGSVGVTRRHLHLAAAWIENRRKEYPMRATHHTFGNPL